jgi:hypothetical protein
MSKKQRSSKTKQKSDLPIFGLSLPKQTKKKIAAKLAAKKAEEDQRQADADAYTTYTQQSYIPWYLPLEPYEEDHPVSFNLQYLLVQYVPVQMCQQTTITIVE